MFNKIKENIQISLNEESTASRMLRIKPAIVIGIVCATVYILSSSFVNIISFPSLHLAVNWPDLLVYWLIFSIAIGIAAVISTWPTAEPNGIVGGGVLMTVIILLANTILFLTTKGNTQSYFQILVATLPLIGVAVLLAWGFRWFASQYHQAATEENGKVKRSKIARLILIVFVVGLIPGIFSRYDLSATNALQSINDRLQSTDMNSISTVKFPANINDEIQKHYGTEYHLSSHRTNAMIGTMNITIAFKDGYAVTCLIPTDGSTFTIINTCAEGSQLE